MTAKHNGPAIEVTDIVPSWVTVRGHPSGDGRVRIVIPTPVDEPSGAIGIIIECGDPEDAAEVGRLICQGADRIAWAREHGAGSERRQREPMIGLPVDATVTDMMSRLARAAKTRRDLDKPFG